MNDCIFCKIINKEIPSSIVYEDERIIAFRDIEPLAPTHILVIPKEHISSLTEIKPNNKELIGEIYVAINKIAEQEKIADKGFRIIVNCGEDGRQEVKHIHFHLIGGKKLGPKII